MTEELEPSELDIETQIVTTPTKPIFGVLAGEPEIVGKRCKDGGTCHHECTSRCMRRHFLSCVPLSGSGLTDSWEAP